MLDFVKITVDNGRGKNSIPIIKPEFICKKSRDLMIRGNDFYAVWDDRNGVWSTDQDVLVELIDNEMEEFKKSSPEYANYRIAYMKFASTGSMNAWKHYVKKLLVDSYVMLDSTLMFIDSPHKRENYATRHLPYKICDEETPGYDELMSVLYSESERRKIEWAIGAVLSGDSKKIQKFLVFYGAMGTGKSTVMNIIEQLFDGYCSPFDASALASKNDSFALEQFKNNPLVAIQHDGDLSRIEDNTKLNSIVSHEKMTVNEKFKSLYSANFQTMLFMGTNRPVKITDAKSGLLRRLIDVHPTGDKLPRDRYDACVRRIRFELGGIAKRCLELYLENPGYYDSYVPINMVETTNDFYNFMSDNYEKFSSIDFVSLKTAWAMYKEYVEYAKVAFPMSMRAFRTELQNYFTEYRDEYQSGDGPDRAHYRSVYLGFKKDKFAFNKKDIKKIAEEESRTTKEVRDSIRNSGGTVINDLPEWLRLKQLDNQEYCMFNIAYASMLAQYATEKETPSMKWENCHMKLEDILTSKLHYVMMPKNHICIDFDLRDKDGNKSLALNLAAASKFPKTYAEVSKGGGGLHLHYIYDGDASELSRIYEDGIEIKVFTGKSSLRRRLSLCNDIPVQHISSGLPLKEHGGGEDKVIDWSAVKNEKALRTMIRRSLNKEYLGATKPEMDFIKKYTDDAYESGLKYDIRDLRPSVMNFASMSTNKAQYCMELVEQIHWCSDDVSEDIGFKGKKFEDDDSDIIFFDVEVFPNLFVVCWKKRGSGGRETVVKMINPTPNDIAALCEGKLVGFNNREYDNDILYARIMGYTNYELFELSQRIIERSKNAGFREAANISYTDIYDFAAKKQSLKKWEIELGIHHQELGLPWDKPVPEELWEKVADYCVNDVIATEVTFEHLAGDFAARKILAAIAGGTPNNTTNQLTTKIIFGSERHPQLVYTDLATGEMSDGGTAPCEINSFPGYVYMSGFETGGKPKNMFRGDDLGFGGWVYAQPDIWYDVALIDVRSMHPWSAINLRYFGEYTDRFKELVEARGYVKLRDLETARKVLDGALAPFLPDDVTDEVLDQLSLALKIAINSVYGLTSAKFENPFRDARNFNNIVALRGALFMRTLQDEIKKLGFEVAHIKTDSIKIPNATPEVIKFCLDFAKKYGYEFEHEATYEKMCLINNAEYIAAYKRPEDCKAMYGYIPGDNKKHFAKHDHPWTATGARFAVPYVFKTLFSHEPITFKDLCETKSVTSAIYLDLNEPYEGRIISLEKEMKDIVRKSRLQAKKTGAQLNDKGVTTDYAEQYDELADELRNSHDYVFIGRCGQFCPIKEGMGGGLLVRESKGKMDSVAGAKGYRWFESEVVEANNKEDDIDKSYYVKMVDDAMDTIASFGDAEAFVETSK